MPLKTPRTQVLALFIFIVLFGALAVSASSHSFVTDFVFGGESHPAKVRDRYAVARADNLMFSFVSLQQGSLSVARAGHTATVLNNGKVLIVGGENQSGFVTEAEIFDPIAGSFSISGNLNTPRADHSATRLSDGRVLIMGGRGDLGTLNTTEIFDPTSGAFTNGPNLQSGRSGHSATALDDGRIVLAGGDAAGSVEILDAAAGGSTSAGALIAARSTNSAVLLTDGRILILGGRDADGNALLSGEVFDPTSFTSKPIESPLAVARVRAHLRVLFDGKVQIIGGSDDGSIEVYDPQVNSFGAYVHIEPEGDTCAGLPGQVEGSQTRAALFHTGQSNATFDRTRHAMSELNGLAVVTGGSNGNGEALSSAPLFNSSGAEISVDKLDYAPGQTVYINGRGFAPREIVRLKVHEDPHTPLERGMDVVADDEGRFVGTYLVQDYDLHMKFLVGGRGLSSGRTAQTSFTDNVPPTVSLNALGTSACEDFNTLANSGTSSSTPSGWAFSESGSSANATYTAGTGSATTGDTYSFGPASTSERAFGGLRTGTLVSTVGAAFTNNTGHTITSLLISYTGEQWRLGATARVDRLDFQYSTDATSLTTGTWVNADSLDFTAPVQGPSVGPLDGNASANRTPKNATISGLSVANGTTLWIRWTDFDAAGADDGLGVDDFCLTPKGPEVSVTVSPSAVAEDGATNFEYTLTRTGSTTSALTVNFNLSFSTATTTDYTVTGVDVTFNPGTATGTVVIPAGNSTAVVTVDPTADATVENDETVCVNVDTGSGYDVGSPGNATSTINNDDTDVSVTVSPVSVAEDGVPNLTYTFTRAGVTTGTLTVNLTASGTASSSGDYALTGAASFDGTNGTVTFGAGNSTTAVTVDPTGDTTFEADETAIITVAAGSSYHVASPSAATGTIQNDDGQPTVQFSLASSSAAESVSLGNLEVTLSNPSDQSITVNYAATGGTATGGGTDYTLAAGTLTFNPGDTSANVSITVHDDALDEDDDTVVVDLSSPNNATLGPSQHTYTIQDNDNAPTVQFSLANSAGVESVNTANLQVTLSAASGKTITVNYLGNGSSTATDGAIDYMFLGTGSLTFTPGDTSENVSLSVNDDSLDENDETVVVDLSSPNNATLGATTQHTYTIQDNDVAPIFTVNEVTLAEGNSGTTNFVFTVTKTGPTALTATVDYVSANGTTDPASGSSACGVGIDYVGQNGTLSFAPNETTKAITIGVCGDPNSEANETFFVNLSNAINATIGDNQGLGTITNDDNVNYNFQGFFAPIDNLPAVNTVKAGASVPVKWRITTSSAAPVSDPASFVGLFSYTVTCGTTDGLETPVETTAPGGSGLNYLGDGNWQLNWKTLASYPKGSCRVLELRLNDGTNHCANFKFK